MRISWKSFRTIVEFEGRRFYAAYVHYSNKEEPGIEVSSTDNESAEWLRDDSNYNRLWKFLHERNQDE